jgi:hypothetical protein
MNTENNALTANLEHLRKSRRNVDWSKHIVETIKEDHSLMHCIRIPNSSTNLVRFVNAYGVLSVSGDFGNWIFCREFHPSAQGYVSDGYWMEKLRSASCQEPVKYDSEATAELLRTEMETDDITEKEKEYLEDALYHSDDEIEYMYYAFRNNTGRYEDYEEIPLAKEVNVWLEIVFDAFNEICRRIQKETK